MKTINFPLMLTLIRLLASPFLLPLFLVYGLPFNYLWLNSVLTIIFVGVCLTDFFDGYLARKYNLETPLGKMLDPIADKFLVYATLVSLLTANKIFFYWVIILIGRELFIMGLRSIALEKQFTIDVSILGKIKTALQMTALAFIILNPYQLQGFAGAPVWNGIELALLVAALFFSLFSAFRYCELFLQKFKEYDAYINIKEEA